MPVDHYPMRDEVNASGILRLSTATGSTTGYNKHTRGPDPTTDQPMNLLITPFDVIRRLAFLEAMGGTIDIRLWWVSTEMPTEIHPDDLFIVVENGTTVHYIVQMVDPGIYVRDTTVCICKREEQ